MSDTPTIGLANLTKQLIVLNLPASIVPECTSLMVVGTRDHDGVTGVRTLQAHRKPVGGSVTLRAKGADKGGDTVMGLPASAARAPDVLRALAARQIKLVEPKPIDPPAPPAPQTEAPPPATPMTPAPVKSAKAKE